MYSAIPFIPVDETSMRMMVVMKIIVLLMLMEMFVVFMYL